MSVIRKKLHHIRQKPQHVRERLLLVIMAVIAPLIITIWFANFKFSASYGGFTGESLDGLKESFNDPVYKETFGSFSPLGASE